MPHSVRLYQKIEKLSRDLKSVMLLVLSEIERNREESVKRKDFEELRLVTLELSKTVKELAEAQKKTEETLRKLIEEHAETRRQLGGISALVGYHLEDRAIRSLPRLLKERFGIDLIERPLRKYVQGKKGTYIEVNILAKGRKMRKISFQSSLST